MNVRKAIGAATMALCVHLCAARSSVGASHVGAGLRQRSRTVRARVIPGATLVLISESRGTKSAPVVSSATGDFVFPNITPDTYTLEVTMSGFKTWRAGRHRGEPRRPHRRARHHARGRRRRPKPSTSRPSRRRFRRRAASARSRSRPKRCRTCRCRAATSSTWRCSRPAWAAATTTTRTSAGSAAAAARTS